MWSVLRGPVWLLVWGEDYGYMLPLLSSCRPAHPSHSRHSHIGWKSSLVLLCCNLPTASPLPLNTIPSLSLTHKTCCPIAPLIWLHLPTIPSFLPSLRFSRVFIFTVSHPNTLPWSFSWQVPYDHFKHLFSIRIFLWSKGFLRIAIWV